MVARRLAFARCRRNGIGDKEVAPIEPEPLQRAMPRAILIVLDSVGIGSAPDAAEYGDDGADTLGHIAASCARGEADGRPRNGALHLPNLVRLGLGEACRCASGRVPPGLESASPP